MSPEFIVALIFAIVLVATPILLAGLGELVVERAGVLNLGVEGMMLIGAVTGFAVTSMSGNPYFGVFCAALAGAAASMIFGFLTLSLSANQVATGLALTIFGGGFSALAGKAFLGKTLPAFVQVFPTELATHPILRVIFGYSPIVYFSLFMCVGIAWFLKSTRAGLILRAVGENDLSAHSIGYNVIGVRYAAVAFGGAMAGIAGSMFSLVLTPIWAEGLTAGRGWIALALVVFAAWKPIRLLVGAYIFGAVMTLEVHAKAAGGIFSALPSELWAALPYLATIIVLVIISLRRSGNSGAPACLGKPFIPTA